MALKTTLANCASNNFFGDSAAFKIKFQATINVSRLFYAEYLDVFCMHAAHVIMTKAILIMHSSKTNIFLN